LVGKGKSSPTFLTEFRRKKKGSLKGKKVPAFPAEGKSKHHLSSRGEKKERAGERRISCDVFADGRRGKKGFHRLRGRERRILSGGKGPSDHHPFSQGGRKDAVHLPAEGGGKKEGEGPVCARKGKKDLPHLPRNQKRRKKKETERDQGKKKLSLH